MEDTVTGKRLYKSRTNRMIDGVCGGFAEYLGVDPTLVRLTFVIMVFFGGLGVVLYLAGLILIPSPPKDQKAATPPGEEKVAPAPGRHASQRSNTMFWGVLLVAVGILWLLSNFGVAIWTHWWGLSWGVVLPVLLILAGVGLLFGGREYVSAQPSTAAPEADGGAVPGDGGETPRSGPARLYRSTSNKLVFGVCGGIGEHFDIDPTIVRLLFVIGAFASMIWVAVLIYLGMAIVVPREPTTTPSG